MDSKLSLFSELCAITSAESAQVRDALWACLGRYTIQPTAAAAGFAESLAAFLSAKRVDGLSERTLGNYRQILSAFDAAIGKPPAAIQADDIRAYLSSLARRGLKKGSIQTHTNALRSFFSWLLAEEQLERSPMSKIRSLRIDRKHTRQPLTAKELERTRNACVSARERALVELLVSSGCRVSEVCNLPLSAIDMATKSFEVTGKGDKRRRVYFSARAELALEEYLARQAPSPLLFPRFGKRAAQRALHQLGIRAKLQENLHPHKLRHTFATLAINRGMDTAILQQLLGHESADTTQIYAKLAQGTIARAYHKAVA